MLERIFNTRTPTTLQHRYGECRAGGGGKREEEDEKENTVLNFLLCGRIDDAFRTALKSDIFA